MTVSFHIHADRRARIVIVSALFEFCFRLSVRSSTTLNGFHEFLLLPHSSPFAVTVPLHAM
jgi:hypothetical protein